MTEPAPIILFAYNRPDLLKKTLESLSKNILAEESKLFVFSDGPKSEIDKIKVDKTRQIIDSIQGFGTVTKFFSETNLGLAESIINGVTRIMDSSGRVIVLEDDLLASPNFLLFMNDALTKYEHTREVFSISGYSHPVKAKDKINEDVFFIPRIGSWGWATWKDRWTLADWQMSDFDKFKKNVNEQKSFNTGGEDLTPMLKAQMSNRINSWAIRWNYTLYKNRGLCLYPKVSKISHIGNTKEGTHVPATDKYDVKLDQSENSVIFPEEIISNKKILCEINDLVKPSFIRKIINYFKYDFNS